LTAVNAMLCKMEPERTATLTVARFDPNGRRLRWAGAGKALPVRFRRSGRATALTGQLGLPVGANPHERYEESTVSLMASDRVMLYTDGLVGERVADLVDAIDAMLGAAGSRANADADLESVETMVNTIVRALHGGPDEDMCAMLVRVMR